MIADDESRRRKRAELLSRFEGRTDGTNFATVEEGQRAISVHREERDNRAFGDEAEEEQ